MLGNAECKLIINLFMRTELGYKIPVFCFPTWQDRVKNNDISMIDGEHNLIVKMLLSL